MHACAGKLLCVSTCLLLVCLYFRKFWNKLTCSSYLYNLQIFLWICIYCSIHTAYCFYMLLFNVHVHIYVTKFYQSLAWLQIRAPAWGHIGSAVPSNVCIGIVNYRRFSWLPCFLTPLVSVIINFWSHQFCNWPFLALEWCQLLLWFVSTCKTTTLYFTTCFVAFL